MAGLFVGRKLSIQKQAWQIGLWAVVACATFHAVRAAEPKEEIPDQLPAWSQSFNLRMGAGYKDNLLLGHQAVEKSALVHGELEASAVRLPFDGTQVLLVSTAEGNYYPNGHLATYEMSVFTVAQVKRVFSPEWEGSFTLQHLFQSQIVDSTTSLDEYAQLGGARTFSVRGHSVRAIPSVQYNLPGLWWLEGAFTVERDKLVQPLDDYWVYAPKLVLGHDFNPLTRVTLTYEFEYRPNDRAPQLDAAGLILPGTHLDYLDHTVTLELRHFWDAQHHWRSLTRLSYVNRQDNGSGFFDYRRYQFFEQLRFNNRNWEFKAQARISYYDYPVQTVSPTDADLRNKIHYQFNFRGERTLNKHLKLFLDYEHEFLTSNRDIDEFHANTVMLGVDLEF